MVLKSIGSFAFERKERLLLYTKSCIYIEMNNFAPLHQIWDSLMEIEF